jgi:hypothetical protein
MDPSCSLSFNAYLGMVNVIGIDRIVSTTDYPYDSMNAVRQCYSSEPLYQLARIDETTF